MSDQYNVFDTEQEAVGAQSSDFAEYLDSIQCSCDPCVGECCESTVRAKTTAWADVVQRATDGKWVFVVCPQSTATGRTVEARQEDWEI